MTAMAWMGGKITTFNEAEIMLENCDFLFDLDDHGNYGGEEYQWSAD
ncbi:MAG: hypothetical protein SVV67_08895 [Bacillota bacterium]|nr:hypothetical protein [Bacillota bacterium]